LGRGTKTGMVQVTGACLKVFVQTVCLRGRIEMNEVQLLIYCTNKCGKKGCRELGVYDLWSACVSVRIGPFSKAE
jgi:hypothetical protein